MWSFLFPHRIKVRKTQKAEAERDKFREDNDFCSFLKDSGKPAHFEKLEAQILSPEYESRKRLLKKFSWKSRRPEEKWSLSKERKQMLEYKQLKKDQDLRRYYTLLKDPVFNQYRCWQLTFEDRFSGPYLNSEKWIVRYYAGERLLKDSYGVGKDVQLFMSGNVELNEKGLCLEFRKESVEGKYWDSKLGIVNKRYAYTSGMVNTALSFRQHKGRFEAKIRVDNSEVEQCFWLAGDGLLPHVNIMKCGQQGFLSQCLTDFNQVNTSDQFADKPVRLKSGYYIFTFDWTAEKLVWKINDCVIKSSQNKLPDLPLFAVLSFGSTKNIVAENVLPAKMQVEWVRFYTENNSH